MFSQAGGWIRDSARLCRARAQSDGLSTSLAEAVTSSQAVTSPQLVEDIESRFGAESLEGVPATVTVPVGNVVLAELEEEVLDSDSHHGSPVAAPVAVPFEVVVTEPASKRVRRLHGRP